MMKITVVSTLDCLWRIYGADGIHHPMFRRYWENDGLVGRARNCWRFGLEDEVRAEIKEFEEWAVEVGTPHPSSLEILKISKEAFESNGTA